MVALQCEGVNVQILLSLLPRNWNKICEFQLNFPQLISGKENKPHFIVSTRTKYNAGFITRSNAHNIL
jgi:hypothetical protein